jgi:hypothetical protein
MSLLRKIVLGVALAAFLVLLAAVGLGLYMQWSRPDIARDGGTVLVYEVDEERSPGAFTPDDLAAALRRRLDPDGDFGIKVRPLHEKRVEVRVPRRGGNHTGEVGQVRELVARLGTLEFRVLANTDDDRDAIDKAQAYFEWATTNDVQKAKLQALERAGDPPPPPRPADGEGFDTPLGRHTYTWVELGPAERVVSGLANHQESEPFWQEMAAARGSQKPVLHAAAGAGPYGTHLFWSREVTNPDRLPQWARDKKYEYFLLCRDEEEGKAVTGVLLESAEAGADPERKRPAVNFRLNAEGTARLAELTRQNVGRRLAIVLDDVIQSAPKVLDPITTGRAVITGDFTKEEVDRMVSILRSGALPTTLKPVPVSETTVEPRK